MLLIILFTTLLFLVYNLDKTLVWLEGIREEVKISYNDGLLGTYVQSREKERLFWSELKNSNSEYYDGLYYYYREFEDVSCKKDVYDEEAGVVNNDVKETNIKEERVKDSKIFLEKPIKILMVGDSLVEVGFGPVFEAELLSYAGLEIRREGKCSTGLNRIDYFDWYDYTEELISEYQPDILIVMFGANDGQNIISSETGKKSKFGTDLWSEIYTERVTNYLDRFATDVDLLYWVGHPIPANDDFYVKFSIMNEIYSTVIENYNNVVYIDSWSRFAKDGSYQIAVADNDGVVKTVKLSDGVHLTSHGGKILSDLVIDYITLNVDFDLKEDILKDD